MKLNIYEALLHNLEMAQLLGTQKLHIFFFYSKLVVCQMQRRYEAKDERIEAYLQQVGDLGVSRISH